MVSLALVTIGVLWPATGNDFLNYDDTLYVTRNAHVRAGLTMEGIRWAFGALENSNWHPLTWLSHMLDVTLFGLKPAGHHLTNVILHAANAVLLLCWLRRMTGAFWRSAVVAALFALHPLHVESVAWVSERKDVLSTMFGFLALWFYAGYGRTRRGEPDKKKGHRDYWLALLFFAFGLLAKPMLVTLPCVMLLLDYWPLQRFKGSEWRASLTRLVREKIPFLLLSLGSCVITVFAQAHGSAIQSLEKLPMDERLANAVISYGRYLGKMIWPANLALPYPPPDAVSASTMILISLLLVSISAGAIALRRRQPFFFVGWFFFLGTLVPVIGLVQVGWQSMADRYTYMPLIGIFVAFVWSAHQFYARRGIRWQWAGITAGVVIAGCAIATRNQLRFWQNSETLLRHAIAVTKDNPIAVYNLGCYLEAKDRTAQAIDSYREAIRISPNYVKAWNNLGNVLANQGRLDEALECYHQALRFDPEHVSTLNNLGVALAAKGQSAEAVAAYEKALELNSQFPQAHHDLGLALEAEGDWEGALRQYGEAVRLQPDYWEAHSRLGSLLLLHRRADDALPHLTETLRLNPNQPQAQFDLGNLFAIKQQYEEAIRHFSEAVRLSPNYAPAHKNMGMALARAGRRSEAITELNEALRLKPDYEEARQQLQVLGPGTR